MTEHEASRTLVKSPPELWAECSSAEALSRHLNGSFGEIRITRLEPETAVAWEGELASGTVRLEPSGWGTKVILTASGEPAAPEPAPAPPPEPVAVAEPEPEAVAVAVAEPHPEAEAEPESDPAAEPPVKVGFFARMRSLFGGKAAAAPEPTPDEAVSEPKPEPEPELEAVPAPEPEPTPEPEPAIDLTVDPDAILAAALDSLGQAHHRPFSRS